MIEMSGAQKVSIKTIDGYTHVFVNDEEVKRLREISFHQSVDEFPIVNLDVYANPSIEMDALVEVKYSADEYLEWLDKMVEESEGNGKIAFKMCRARYLSYFGSSYDDIDNV